MLARFTVVEPTTNGLQVFPSVEYSSETAGAEPFAAIATVELASYAVKQSGLGIGNTVHPVGIALIPVVVSEPL